MQMIPFLPGATSGDANDVSADGNTVVGTSMFDASVVGPPASRPFLYDANSGALTNLGAPMEGDDSSSAQAISGDGTTVVGVASSGVWTWTGGTPRLLTTRLAELGVDLGDFQLTDVVDVSANGKVLVGTGHPGGGGADEGWIVLLP